MKFRVLTLGVAAMLALAGCSGDGDKPKAEKTPATSVATSADPGQISPEGLPSVPEVKGAVGAVKDLTLDECPLQKGKQTVAGTIKSSAAKRVDYVVVVDWVNGSSVQGRGVKVLKGVEPGSTTKFKISAKVAVDATSCIPNVRYGRAAG